MWTYRVACEFNASLCKMTEATAMAAPNCCCCYMKISEFRLRQPSATVAYATVRQYGSCRAKLRSKWKLKTHTRTYAFRKSTAVWSTITFFISHHISNRRFGGKGSAVGSSPVTTTRLPWMRCQQWQFVIFCKCQKVKKNTTRPLPTPADAVTLPGQKKLLSKKFTKIWQPIGPPENIRCWIVWLYTHIRAYI